MLLNMLLNMFLKLIMFKLLMVKFFENRVKVIKSNKNFYLLFTFFSHLSLNQFSILFLIYY